MGGLGESRFRLPASGLEVSRWGPGPSPRRGEGVVGVAAALLPRCSAEVRLRRQRPRVAGTTPDSRGPPASFEPAGPALAEAEGRGSVAPEAATG